MINWRKLMTLLAGTMQLQLWRGAKGSCYTYTGDTSSSLRAFLHSGNISAQQDAGIVVV